MLIADDHEALREGIRRVAEKARFEVVGEASDGQSAVRLAHERKPSVAILDYSLAHMNAAETTRSIKSASPRTNIIIFSNILCDNEIIKSLRSGATGLVLKSDAIHHLFKAIHSVFRGVPYFSPQLPHALLESKSGYIKDRFQVSFLTEREIEVVRLIANGGSNKDVAQALGVACKTIETHRASVMRKLNLATVADLVRYAIRNNIIAL
ncbi:response regulator transcription factor (plasmid) [Novosphingobium sp. BL-8A]|uniref:response regulator n=1 Tax=Novosphingobium sp. BL-8A TaxID=3127639 RepID=UPI0037570226